MTATVSRPALAVLLLAGVAAGRAQQVGPPAAVPIDPIDMLRAPAFASRGAIDLSPDGALVAYTLERQEDSPPITDPRYMYFSRSGVPIDSNRGSLQVADVKTGAVVTPAPGATSWAPRWSPDGRTLAFFSDEGGRTAVWIWDRTTRNRRRAADAIARPFFAFDSPQWLPNNRDVVVKLLPESLTFEQAADLFVTEREKRQDRNDPTRPSVTVFGERQLAGQSTPSAAPTESGPSRAVLARYLSDIGVVDVTTGRIRRIARDVTPVSMHLAPDGRHLALAEMSDRRPPGTQVTLYKVSIVSVADGQKRLVAEDVSFTYGRTMSWSPEGARLLYVTNAYNAREGRVRGEVFVVNADGTDFRRLADGQTTNFGANYYSPPRWSLSGQTVFLVADGRVWSFGLRGGAPKPLTESPEYEVLELVAHSSLGRALVIQPEGAIVAVVRNRRTLGIGFQKVGVETGRSEVMLEQPMALPSRPVFGLDVSDAGDTIVFSSEDASHAGLIQTTDLSWHTPRTIASIAPMLDRYAMGASRLVEWQSATGATLRGAVLLPAVYSEGTRYPVIADVYGGATDSNRLHRFGLGDRGIENAQLLASRGYVVFMPDLPQRVGTPMADIAAAALPGFDKLVELGIADPDRLALAGTSYGGYTVMSLLVQSTRFKAAVVISTGATDLTAGYSVMSADGGAPFTGWSEEGQGLMGGTPWQFRDRYVQNSPLNFLDRVTTPVLLIHGERDTIPSTASDAIFVGLRRLGKEVVYAKYARGDHGASSFDRTDALDYFERMARWFGERLRRPAAPSAQQTAPALRPTPPTRDPNTPGYVAARELPDGTVPRRDDDGNFIIGPTHTPAPEMTVQEGVPQGTVHAFTTSSADSKIYPGIARDTGTFGTPDPNDPANLVVTTSHPAPYTRRVAVYVPKQYVPGTVAPFIVGADGPDQLLFTALDNLIALKRVPVMIAISIGNGSGDAQGSQRGLEYDTMSGRYAEFVETEVLPFVEKQYDVKLTKDPEGRATMGCSSGGSAALIMAWYRPDLYHRVLTYSGTYVNQQWPPSAETPHGAWEFHERLIPTSPVKPIRIWMDVGDRDLLNPNVMRDNMHDWVIANENMAKVLAAKRYNYQFVFARNAGHCDRSVKLQTLPAALEWLWKGYPIQ